MHRTRFLIYCIAILLLVSSVARSFAQDPNSISGSVNCSVIIQGVERGEIKLEFYQSVCGGEDRANLLETALRSAEAERLKLFKPDKADAPLINQVMSRPGVASAFFKNAKDTESFEWFEKQIEDNIDPNLLVYSAKNARVSLFQEAMVAENLNIAKHLLRVGATPHIFDQLWGKPYESPLMLFPMNWLEQVSTTRTEKFLLLKAMVSAGMVVPDRKIPKSYFANGQMTPYDQKIASLEMEYGTKFRRQNSVCERQQSQICKAPSERGNFDWCSEVHRLPERLVFKELGSFQDDYHVVDFVGLIGVFEQRMYVLVYLEGAKSYGLSVVDKDLDKVIVYAFTQPQAGMGHCANLLQRNGGVPVGDPKNCWRRIELVRSDKKNELKDVYGSRYLIVPCP